MKTALVTAPIDADLPMTLTDAKNWLRVTHSNEDALITTIYKGVIEIVERLTNRKLATQTLNIYFDTFPECSHFELPFTPLQSILSISYYDENDSLTVLSPTKYNVDDKNEPPCIHMNEYNASSWPNLREKPNAVIVQGIFGNKSDALAPQLAVPKGLMQAVRYLIQHWYDNKEMVLMGAGVPMEVPNTFEMAILAHKIWYHY